MSGGLAKRLSAIERSVTTASNHSPIWHRFILEPGETLESEIDAFGRDRIGPDDSVIVRRIVDVGVRKSRKK